MAPERMSALDASFLRIETPTAHMHVGWAATFAAPDAHDRPDFEAIRTHIAGRLCRAPRYRQRILPAPLGMGNPAWADDGDFDIARHVHRASSGDFAALIDAVMSAPLAQDRPLWELWVADRIDGDRLGIVGKAHHCMVDGLAAVELATLLLDPSPVPPRPEPDDWSPRHRPSTAELLVDAAEGAVSRGLALALAPARALRSPFDALRSASDELDRASRAFAHLLEPAVESSLNRPISARRHLARARRPLAQLKEIRRRHGATVNDVVLAACSGALRQLQLERDEAPARLKTMVPVSVRDAKAEAGLGNGISFVFVDLPCHDPDPLARLRLVQGEMGRRKQTGEPEGGVAIMRLIESSPPPLQAAAARLAASSRAFNLTISNIPGPAEPLYMLGCRLEEAYPVVPLADRHGLSIGMTSIGPTALFGVYADPEGMPDADRLAELIGEAIDEFTQPRGRRAQAPRSSRQGHRGDERRAPEHSSGRRSGAG